MDGSQLASVWYPILRDGWRLLPFRRVALIRNGQVDPRDEHWRDLPLFAPNHIESATGRLLGVETAAGQAAESGKYPVARGEIVYSKIRPGLRKVMIAPFDGLCSADMYAIRPARGVEARFLFWVMLADGFSEAAMLASDRVAMPKVNRETLADFPVPVPPSAAQLAIADFLDRKTAAIDALIDKKERLIALFEKRRAAVLQRVVTKGLDPTVVVRHSGVPSIGSTPSHWKLSRPKFLSNRIVDGTHYTPEYVDEGIPFVTVKNLTAGPGISLEDTKFISSAEHALLTRRAKPERGDLLISKDGTLGVTRVVETDRPFSIFVSVALLKLRKQLIDGWYLRFAFESDALWQQFEETKSGSGLKHLILGDIGDVRVPLPPLAEQREIATRLIRVVAAFDERDRAVRLSIERLREYRQSLITAAVTGQLPITA